MLPLTVALASVAGVASLHAVGDGNIHDDCECKQWSAVYKSGVECGANLELFFAHHNETLHEPELSRLKASLGAEFCTNFYEKLHDNFCVNVNMGQDEGQWCFVDSYCEGPNISPANAQGLKLKYCGATGHLPEALVRSWRPRDPFTHHFLSTGAGSPKMLRKYSPEELADLAEGHGLDLGLLHKMSYPLHRGHLWKQVASVWSNVPEHPIRRVPRDLKQYFKTTEDLESFIRSKWDFPYFLRDEKALNGTKVIKASNQTYSFDMSEDQHPPHIIVQGEKVYLVLGGLIRLA